MLKVQSLSARRGGRMVFRDVGFGLQPGQLLLVTGANGSGKSSLLRVLAGLLNAAKGDISWQDQNIKNDIAAHRDRVHYIGHLDALKPELTVAEMLDYWRALRNSPPRKGEGTPAAYALENRLEFFGITSLYDRPVRALSAGQKRRLTLTRLMMDDAPLWLLDEPTNALDHHAQLLLNGIIAQHRAKGGIAVIATHHKLDFPDAKQLAIGEE